MWSMELGDYSEDRLDQVLIEAESEIASWRAVNGPRESG